MITFSKLDAIKPGRLLAEVRQQLKHAYKGQAERQFRATNLVYIGVAAIFLIMLLLGLFVFENSGYLDKTAKTIFGALFLVIIAVFIGCIRFAISGKLEVARFIVVAFCVAAVLLAISITGGFPFSVASPAIMIPVVMCYCLYGARASLTTTMIMLGLLMIQWAFISAGKYTPPNYVSMASQEFNSVVVILATVAVACSVLAIFDASSRIYIRRANASMQSKTNFLANTSHEIRTPMNGIIGLSEVMMRTTDLDADQKMYMEAIHQSGTALMTIINDILDYSRLDAGRLDIQNERFNFYTLVHEIRTLMTINAAGKNVIIRLVYPNDLPQNFIGDPGRIRQVLINLIANAVKFTEDGSITITVEIEHSGDQAKIRTMVEDTGIGIAQEKLSSIFERFTQADSGATQKYGGTGLGLSISQKLVELMGGRMGVRSVINEGSTFWFDIKLPIAEDMVSVVRGTDEQNIAPLRPVTGSQVLILTHRAETIEGFGNALYAQGYRVFHTSDIGQLKQWLRSIDAQNVDDSLVVLDESLPEQLISEHCLAIRKVHSKLRVMNIDPENGYPEDLVKLLESKLKAKLQ